jgi:lipopolysaccharide export system permease protein
LLPSVLLYLIYLMSLKAGQDKVVDGELNVFVGIWGVHLAFLLFGLVMFNWPALSKIFSTQKRKSVAEGIEQ